MYKNTFTRKQAQHQHSYHQQTCKHYIVSSSLLARAHTHTVMHSLIPILLTTAAAVVSAQDAPAPVPVPEAQTTIGVFLGAKRDGDYEFGASIISADEDATTYLIRCESGDLNLPGFPTTTCDENDPASKPPTDPHYHWTIH